MSEHKATVWCIFFLGVATTCLGTQPYTAPDGDLNRDGVVDVVDLQCEVLLFDVVATAEALVEDACAVDLECPEQSTCRAGPRQFKMCIPNCMSPDVAFFAADDDAQCEDPQADDPWCLGTVARLNADLNCDDAFTNVDLLFLVALVLDKVGGPATADLDNDGQLNFCDPDSDDDGVLDEDDCAALEADVGLCEDADPCTLDLCEDGICVFQPTTGPYCDDEDPCTHSDICSEGACAGEPYACDDSNGCTDDSCLGDGECEFLPNRSECNDSNDCTFPDLCSEGQCGGTPYNCDDSNVCTDDWCNGDGTCGHSNNSASCGPNKTCQNGQCVALCTPGDYASWSGSCSGFCANKGCGSAQVFGAPHGNLCGCACCQPASGGTYSGPYGGGFSDCQFVAGGWIPICATTCRCAL